MTKLATVEISKPEKGQPHAFLATPSFDGKTCQAYTASLVASAGLLQREGIGATYCLMAGNCHVDDARNALVREFLMSDCDCLVFLDADIGWRPEDLVSLIKCPAQFVGGIYPKKTDELEFPVYVEPGTTLQADGLGLVEVHGLPTGFLKISRKAILEISQTYGHRKYTGQNDGPNDPPYVILFERTYENGHRWSGDYAFCQKWRGICGRLYVDPRFAFIHEGSKEWSGCLGDFWKEKHGINKAIRDSRFEAAIEALVNNTEKPEDIIALIDGYGNDWSAQAEFLMACVQAARNAKGPILECGCGLTTIAMALVTDQQVIALENSPIWAEYVTNFLNKYCIPNVRIICSPLVDYGDYEWYPKLDEFMCEKYDLVVCDGPARTSKGGRRGIREIKDCIDGLVILDDVDKALIEDYQEYLGIEFHMYGELKPFAIGGKRNV